MPQTDQTASADEGRAAHRRHRRRSRLAAIGVAVAMAASLEAGVQLGKAEAALPAAAARACHVVPAGPRDPVSSKTYKAYSAMLRDFCAKGLFSDTQTQHMFFPTTAWPLSQAISADLSIAAMAPTSAKMKAQVAGTMDTVGPYWNTRTAHPAYASGAKFPFSFGGGTFYDDNDWIALDFVRAYRLTGDSSYLARAEKIFEFEHAGWQSHGNYPKPGGEFWEVGSAVRSRNTVSTAGAAQLALSLYAETGQVSYVTFATRALAWVDATLKGPNGLYYDNITPQGALVKYQWAYNQGLMLGAYAMLYQATGQQSALTEARQIAADTLAQMPLSVLKVQTPIFPSIFFQNLSYLNTFGTVKGSVDAMHAYARWLNTQVDHSTGVVLSGQLRDQAALVQINAAIDLSPSKVTMIWGPRDHYSATAAKARAFQKAATSSTGAVSVTSTPPSGHSQKGPTITAFGAPLKLAMQPRGDGFSLG